MHDPTSLLAVPTDLQNYDQTLAQLLVTRGITTKQAAESFLAPNYETGLHDPFLLHTMAAAVERIKAAMINREKIAVFSDYDADGIPGAVVLYDLFAALAYDNVVTYIPHRHYEGFGLSEQAVEKLAADGVRLIITVDCGTTDGAAISRATALGLDVIVTDHHEAPATLPQAVAIVNPKLGTYPFPHLCGAGVAFKLALALLRSTEHTLPQGMEKWWLDMVGLATIADMVPLVEENRIFAHYGLTVLRKSRRPGLQQLLKKARLNPRYLSEDDIGFTIAPRINAASRMDAPERAFSLLTIRDEGRAGSMVLELESLNNERKGAVAAMTRELHAHLKALPTIPDVIVYGNPLWRPALAGLAATKVADEYHRPTFIWGRDGNGIIKGSCRAGGAVSVVALMAETSEIFLEYGGHHASGGFAVKENGIFTLSRGLNEAFKKIAITHSTVAVLTPELHASLDELPRLNRLFTQLAPFGMGNPKPLVAFGEVVPRSVEHFGKGKEHVKLSFRTLTTEVEAIAFFTTTDQFSKVPRPTEACTLLAYIEQSYFMNRSQLRLRVVDIV
jgi:single-stranded-DNA-specific exonuclease